jgi:serine/threonine protein kinase
MNLLRRLPVAGRNFGDKKEEICSPSTAPRKMASEDEILVSGVEQQQQPGEQASFVVATVGSATTPLSYYSDPPGKNFEPINACYIMGDVLGAGSFSVVREATQRATGKRLAVKIFNPEKSGREAALKEIAILQESAHAGVVKFVEYFEEDGRVCMVTEVVPGRDASACLSERGSYSEDDCRTIVKQVLSVLVHMHSKGISHRDLKLDNIVFGENDDLSSLRLIDFGLASQYTLEKPFFSKSCGTPAYCAPEVLRRDARYGTSCDIWSLGVTLFMLLSGEPPFAVQASDLRELVLAIRSGSFSMADPAWALVSDEAQDFVKQLLVVDPATRLTARSALEHPWLNE